MVGPRKPTPRHGRTWRSTWSSPRRSRTSSRKFVASARSQTRPDPGRVRRAERDRRDRPRRRRRRRAHPAPVDGDAAVRDPQGRDRPGGTETGKVVTVFSPKGGSGKTVLATNLAAAAARSGIKTLLVDLDLQFGDSALTLGVSPRATIADLTASRGDIDLEKLKSFIMHRPPDGGGGAARAHAPGRGGCGRPGQLGAVLGRPHRLRRGRDRHGAAVRRRDARGARPQRPAAARLQPRGDVAQERPHRARDDRPPRLRHASASRSWRIGSAPQARSPPPISNRRWTRRSPSSCPTTQRCRTRSTARIP